MDAKEFARKHYRLDDFPEIEKVYLESAIHFAESYHQSKLAEMPSGDKMNRESIQIANRSQFKSNYPYDHKSVEYGAWNGMIWLKQHLTKPKQEEGDKPQTETSLYDPVFNKPEGEDNKCIKCGKPVGNNVFTVCDDCWDESDREEEKECNHEYLLKKGTIEKCYKCGSIKVTFNP